MVAAIFCPSRPLDPVNNIFILLFGLGIEPATHRLDLTIIPKYIQLRVWRHPKVRCWIHSLISELRNITYNGTARRLTNIQVLNITSTELLR